MASGSREIAIVTDDPGWHGRKLVESFSSRGYRARYIRLQDCHLNLSGNHPFLQIPCFTALPYGVFVRGVPGGSLEEVVYYLDILHALEAMGVPVVNNVRAIERSVDKGMTSFLLKHKGVPTPSTFVSSDLHYIRSKIREGMNRGKRFVLKPLFGSQGKGLQLIRCASDQIVYDETHGVMYAQEFVDSGHDMGVDFRVFVIGDQVIASMKRKGIDWISNVALGACVESVNLDRDVANLALDAVRAVGMEYAGVDLIQDVQGKFWVTEVNSVPAWKGLQQTTNTSIVGTIVDDFINRCEKGIA